MKLLVVIFLIALSSCGREASPDGRSRLRDEKIQKQIDSLKEQNKVILDSLGKLSKQLKVKKEDG